MNNIEVFQTNEHIQGLAVWGFLIDGVDYSSTTGGGGPFFSKQAAWTAAEKKRSELEGDQERKAEKAAKK